MAVKVRRPETQNGGTMTDIFEKVKDQVKIADAVEAFGIKLNSRDKGLCPFHREKTPSFSIDRKNNIFTCFGCGETGDVITFVSKIKEVEPLEAAKLLAEMFHIDVDDCTKRTSIKDYLKACIKDADKTDYFQKRGLTKETVKKYCLGYDVKRNAIVLPYSSELRYYQTRSISDKKFYKPTNEEAGAEPLFNRKALWGTSKEPVFMRDIAVKGFETIKISVSAGAVWGKGERAEEIVGRADEFMYRAKKTKDLLVAEDDEGKLSASAEKQLVLIVDDSEINRVILKEILRGEYEIIEAASGEECVNALKKYGTKVSVVLLDIIMPGMNGFDVLEYMTYNQLLSEIPVVAISGDETGETVRRAYEAGVSDYINRPFDARVVYRRVKNTVKVYSEQKRLISSVTREMREKEEATNALISLFGELVEFRNDFGGNHVKNIGKITQLLLERLVTKTQKYNLSERDIFLISTASALHDVGKFAVKEEIVNKPAKLTDAEFEEMKKHTIYGAQVISGAKNFRNRRLMEYAYEICRWHHERYDGKGYPDGLSGEEIPISAQVTGVGDAYDALVSERVYKKAVPHEQAIEKILRGECGAFNPVLLECLSEISEDLKKL